MDKQTQAFEDFMQRIMPHVPLSGISSPKGKIYRSVEATNAQVVWNAAIKASGAEHLGELVRALEPFAHFIKQYKRQPLRGQDDVYVSIHLGSEFEAQIKLSDLEKASDALSKLPPELRGE